MSSAIYLLQADKSLLESIGPVCQSSKRATKGQ